MTSPVRTASFRPRWVPLSLPDRLEAEEAGEHSKARQGRVKERRPQSSHLVSRVSVIRCFLLHT